MLKEEEEDCIWMLPTHNQNETAVEQRVAWQQPQSTCSTILCLLYIPDQTLKCFRQCQLLFSEMRNKNNKKNKTSIRSHAPLPHVSIHSMKRNYSRRLKTTKQERTVPKFLSSIYHYISNFSPLQQMTTDSCIDYLNSRARGFHGHLLCTSMVTHKSKCLQLSA